MQNSIESIVKEEIKRSQEISQEICEGVKQRFSQQLCRPVHSLISWLLIFAMIQGSLLVMATAFAQTDTAIEQTMPRLKTTTFNKTPQAEMEKLIESPAGQSAEPLKWLIAPGGPIEVSPEQWCQINGAAVLDECDD